MAAQEEGYNKIVIGIDKDKNSQAAFKWAIDNLVKVKNILIILIHVKTNSHQAHDPIPKEGRAPNETERQQFFLLYRGFCARKGINTEEVVLRETDVSKGLISYITTHSIGSVVVGASSRNALLRRFKQTDVPTSLAKSAPEYCGVYVISSKGKLQSFRSPNRPSTPTTPKSESSTNNNTTSTTTLTLKPSYFQSNHHPKSSTNGGRHGVNIFSGSDNNNPRLSSNTPRINQLQIVPFSPSDHHHGHNDFNDSASIDTPRSQTPRLQNLLLLPPPSTTNTGEYPSSRRYEDFERVILDRNNEGQYTPSRYMPSPEAHRGRGKGSYLVRQMSSANSNSSSSSCSSHSSKGIEIVSMNHRFFGSTDRRSFGSPRSVNVLEAEMMRLRQEIHKSMELYQSIGHQANLTRQKIEGLLGQKSEQEYSTADMKLARETTMVLAELEGLKGKVALDIAKMSEQLRGMERKKREIEEERAKREEIQKKRANNALLTRSPTMQYRIYTLEEIELATDYFSESLKIGEGGYGPVYKGILDNTPVAIKVLRPDVSQGLRQFQNEIEVLGHIRHPHMVLLLGACPEYGCLVYEYMENGSLEDRLFCKGKTPPIPWQARFRIAYEIAMALLFLHETKPEPMVHRDLKPANILLDGKYTSKISDVGLARLVPAKESNDNKTQYHMTAAAGTFCYIDPEYQQTGLLGTKSDVYSLGVVLLQLLTAKPAMALAYHVEEAIEMGHFNSMLDPTIRHWPIQQAQSLAQLALQCCELRKKDRPDLGSVILPHLFHLRDFAINS